MGDGGRFGRGALAHSEGIEVETFPDSAITLCHLVIANKVKRSCFYGDCRGVRSRILRNCRALCGCSQTTFPPGFRGLATGFVKHRGLEDKKAGKTGPLPLLIDASPLSPDDIVDQCDVDGAATGAAAAAHAAASPGPLSGKDVSSMASRTMAASMFSACIP